MNNRLRLSSLFTMLFIVLGSVFFVGGMASEGSKFDLYEFCFKPKQFTDQDSEKNYCTSDKTYTGVTWVIASEKLRNPELNKITYIRGIKATNPYAGWYGLGATTSFAIAYLIFTQTTNYYLVLLNSRVRDYEKQITEAAILTNKELELLAKREALNVEYVSEKLDREQADRLYALKHGFEKKSLAEAHQYKIELDNQLRQLKHATIKADIAEESKREAEATLDAHKASQKLQDPWGDEVSTKGTITSLEALKQRLKEHEDGWMWELTNSTKPLWIVGAMGSGKSYFAASLVLCRYLFREWNLVSLSDPQYHQNQHKAWKYLKGLNHSVYGITDTGEGFDWEGIEEAMYKSYERWGTRTEKDPVVQSVWDEVTNYSSNVALTQEWSLRLNSDPRKSNEAIILLSHGKTAIASGGGKGLKEIRDENSIYLKLTSKNDQTPTYKGRLEGWKDDDGNLLEEVKVTVPHKWFNPDSILSLKNSLK